MQYSAAPSGPAYGPMPPGRPASVTAAAVILLTIGSLALFFGLLFVLFAFVFGSVFSEIQSVPGFREEIESQGGAAAFDAIAGAATAIFLVFGLIFLIWTASHVVSGIGILGRRGWARILGLVVASIGELLALLGVVGSVVAMAMATGPTRDPSCPAFYTLEQCQSLAMTSSLFGLLFTGLFAIAYGFAAYALIRRGAWFDWRPMQPAPAWSGGQVAPPGAPMGPAQPWQQPPPPAGSPWTPASPPPPDRSADTAVWERRPGDPMPGAGTSPAGGAPGTSASDDTRERDQRGG